MPQEALPQPGVRPSMRRLWASGGGLALLLAAMLALLGGSFAYMMWRDYRAAEESGWQSAERGALGVAEHTRRTVSVARLVAQSVARTVRRDGLARLQGEGWQEFAALAEQTAEVTTIWVTDAAGIVAAGSMERQVPRTDWSARSFFAPLRDGAAGYLMPLTWGTLTRNWFLSYSVAIRADDGAFLGIAQSALFTDDVRRAYAELDLPPGARAGVFRAQDGAPLIQWPLPPAAERSVQAPAPPEAAAIIAAARTALAEGRAAGRLELGAGPDALLVAWRSFDEDGPVVAAMLLPRAVALASFAERLHRGAAVLVLAIAALGALGSATARAQRRAAAGEALFRGTFEQAAVGMAHLGLGGRWLRANARLCAMLGYRVPELRDRTLEDMTYPDDRAEVLAAMRRLVAGGIATFTLRTRCLRRDGTVLHAELTASLLRHETTGRPLHAVAVLQDIGPRLEAEAARAASERRLALACAAIGIGVFDVDSRTGLAEVNAQWREIFGLPPSDAPVPLEERLSLAHPDDRARVRARTLAAYADGTGYDERFRIVRRDTGEVRWVAARGAFVDAGAPRFLGLIQDITARHEAEESRKASEERLALASAAAGMGVFDVDTRTGLAVVSAQWRAVYGLPPGDAPVGFEGRMALVHPEDRAAVRAAVRDAFAAGGTFAVEFRIHRQDTGELRWLATRGSYQGDASPPERFLGVTYDITERKREQERESMLAREVDHRARNVLAVVRSIVKLSRADDPRRFAEAVEGRVAALARAHTLLARDRWTGAGLAEIVQEELAAYASAGDASRRVSMRGPALRLRPDAVQPLSMVLHELATNAAKHGALSVPAGRLAVDWRLEDETGEACLVLEWREHGGPAIAAPPLRRGFGSKVVEATVRTQMDGEVACDWRPAGLACTIRLPGARVLAAAAGEDPAAAAAPQAGAARAMAPGTAAAMDGPVLAGRRVLLVEDEPLLALELAAALAEAGCEVVGPDATLPAALDRARAEAARLDAAVLDANLNGLSSQPVAALLARHGVPVVYVTGYSALPPEAGGALLLTKPLRDGDLAGALRTLLQATPAT